MQSSKWVRVSLFLGLLVGVGCGGSGKKKIVDGGHDGPTDAPHEGTGDTGGGGGASGDAATDGAADAATESGSDTSADAPASETGDAPGETAPPFDAGIGCLPPVSTETPLAPATEGVPAQGLVLWLRADHGIYMTPGAGAVCAWADQSGHGRILTAGTGRPLWNTNAVGGKESVHFMGGTTSLGTGGVLDIPPASGRTFVAVTTLVSTTGRFEPIIQGKVGSPGTYVSIDTNSYNTAGSREGVYMTNNAYDSALATSTSPRVHVYTVSTMAPGTAVLSALDYRVNGAAQTLTRTSGGLGNGNIEDFTSADFTAVGGADGDANVAEVLVYDRALGADEKTALETALKARYGIQ